MTATTAQKEIMEQLQGDWISHDELREKYSDVSKSEYDTGVYFLILNFTIGKYGRPKKYMYIHEDGEIGLWSNENHIILRSLLDAKVAIKNLEAFE